MRPVLSRSLWHPLAVAAVAIVGFVLLAEDSMFDSPDPASLGLIYPAVPPAGSRLLFTATAYCKGTTTASGIRVRSGIAAADRTILPLGSIVNITTEDTKYQGLYTILDTGPAVQGRLVDLYMWSCYEALDFGRQQIELTVLRLGWSPEASAPSLIDRLFQRREAARSAAPPPPPLPEATEDTKDTDATETTQLPQLRELLEPAEPVEPVEPPEPEEPREPVEFAEPAVPQIDPVPVDDGDDGGESEVTAQPDPEPPAAEGPPAP